jgi:hypothetical protein
MIVHSSLFSTSGYIIIVVVISYLAAKCQTCEDARISSRGSCFPGINNSPNQLQWTVWKADFNMNLPIYSTHNLETVKQYKVEHIIIILHGNLRNANSYFCSGVEVLSDFAEIESYLIVTPQFLIIGDNCWLDGILYTGYLNVN